MLTPIQKATWRPHLEEQNPNTNSYQNLQTLNSFCKRFWSSGDRCQIARQATKVISKDVSQSAGQIKTYDRYFRIQTKLATFNSSMETSGSLSEGSEVLKQFICSLCQSRIIRWHLWRQYVTHIRYTKLRVELHCASSSPTGRNGW